MIIENAQSIASMNALLIDDPNATLNEKERKFLYQPFLVTEFQLDVLMRVCFSSLTLKYGNNTVLFTMICNNIVFTTNPYLFDMQGLIILEGLYNIGIYINGTDVFEDIREKEDEEQ